MDLRLQVKLSHFESREISRRGNERVSQSISRSKGGPLGSGRLALTGTSNEATYPLAALFLTIARRVYTAEMMLYQPRRYVMPRWIVSVFPKFDANHTKDVPTEEDHEPGAVNPTGLGILQIRDAVVKAMTLCPLIP